MNQPESRPHRRFNPLTGDWVLVSPQRTQRPWLGLTEREPVASLPSFDPDCYLCPRAKRANGAVNPDYSGVWVFDNDFPALETDQVWGGAGDPLLRAEPVTGTCRVICFSPDHGRSMALLSQPQVREIVDCWAEQSAELGKRYTWVQIFENRGAAMGCSNPHPHGQIWASSAVPAEPMREDRQQFDYLNDTGRSLLPDVAERERSGPRSVLETAHWLLIVPWWAVWPFETLLLPLRGVARIEELTGDERDDLAFVLRRLTACYDALFACPFPYSMGWHGAPYLPGDQRHWQLHAHFYPPLLRSATVRKFMVGYEMLAEAQRDLTPEQAAEQLRKAMPPVTH